MLLKSTSVRFYYATIQAEVVSALEHDLIRQRYVVSTTWGNLQERECDVGEENSGKLLPDATNCIQTSIGAEFFEPSTVSQIKGPVIANATSESSFQNSPKRPFEITTNHIVKKIL